MGGGVLTNVCVRRYSRDAQTITQFIIKIIIIVTIIITIIIIIIIIIILNFLPCQNWNTSLPVACTSTTCPKYFDAKIL